VTKSVAKIKEISVTKLMAKYHLFTYYFSLFTNNFQTCL